MFSETQYDEIFEGAVSGLSFSTRFFLISDTSEPTVALF